jgi:hypothetical protein
MKNGKQVERGVEASARRLSPRPQAARYATFLAEEGFRPKIEPSAPSEASMIVFKVEGSTHLLSVLEDDPTFFHLAVCYETSGEGVALPALLEQANRCNRAWKGIKVGIDPDDNSIEFHCESFLEDPERFESVLPRAISALGAVASAFFSELRSTTA